jgi:hypothetical protein
MGSPSDGAGSSGGPGGNDGPGGSDSGGGARESAEAKSRESSKAGMTGSERTQAAEAKNEKSFSESLAEAKAEHERSVSPNDDGGSKPTTAPETPATPETEEENERGVLDRVGDFFGGIATGLQNFARENPRVDSHGNTVGLVDANGIQRGKVASRVMSWGTSPSDLASQLGFSSPQNMAAAQTTGFIDEKYQEQKAQDLKSALEERYGAHPDLPSLLSTAGLLNNFAPEDVPNPNMLDEMSAYAASAAFGDIEYTMNNVNVVSAAEAKLRQGDIDGYYQEIDKIDPYGDLAIDVRQQLTASGVIAEDYYRDTLEKEGYTEQQIDDLWAKDTRALALADLAARKAEFGSYNADTMVNAYDGVLSEQRIAQYHKDAMQERYDNWTGKTPFETLGTWMATTPEARVALANDMVAAARSGNAAAQAWVDEVIGDWDTVFATPGEAWETLPESLGLVGPAISGIIRNQWDAIFGDEPQANRLTPER